MRKHEEIKQRILRNPMLIGLDKSRIIHVETEYPLIKRKRPIAQPDIMFEYRIGNRVRRMFIEVKSGSCRRAVQDLEFQLRKVERFLHRKNIEGDVLGVYGNALNVLTVD